MAGGLTIAALLVLALAFVFYFMDAVYEVEDLLDPADVPPAVRAALDAAFAGAADTEWKLADEMYEAAFDWQDQEEVEAYFFPDGRRERTEFPLSFEDLPARARTYLADQRLKVAAIERVERPGQPISYEAEIGNLLVEYDCLFDADGNLTERLRDESPLEEE